eukprot:CAMPEP_0183292962 /NCGR_PEP_ID=MMETSP0160_2-20130417/1837_1 /TAXON_ID=2839 ORGANISM="Odontella Sinensis, Strain Grunow 1884" /NCGR_SAMPLE_ID=MMETSP0160_2 /ASSEMBLY_ACC=CAM_ASM_000250 /LENGTH=245 /DNA_ID=CAMNT_0025454007 /DNA_START=59 /DNA_END=796 /DNA_ORIENTATION=-
MSASLSPSKKRKTSASASASLDTELKPSINGEGGGVVAGGKKRKKQNGGNNTEIDDGYVPLTLSEIKSEVYELRAKVPRIPEGGLNPDDEDSVRCWAKRMQAVIEEFNLLLSCVSSATYKWGSDRSGAADQNLTVLSGELGNAQEQIASSVNHRLSNVLAPVVDLVIKKTVTTKNEETGEEVKVNHFIQERVDPDFLRLGVESLCRNAPMLRRVVLANFHKVDSVIIDYTKATKKDSSHDRGMAY